MGIATVGRFAAVAFFLLALPLRTLADTPLSPGAAGPMVQGLQGPLPTTVFSSERDL